MRFRELAETEYESRLKKFPLEYHAILHLFFEINICAPKQ